MLSIQIAVTLSVTAISVDCNSKKIIHYYGNSTMDSAFSAIKIDVTRSIKRSKNRNQLALNYTKSDSITCQAPPCFAYRKKKR